MRVSSATPTHLPRPPPQKTPKIIILLSCKHDFAHFVKLKVHAYSKMCKFRILGVFKGGGRDKGVGVAEKYFLICIPLCFEVDRTKY